jgi:hypothetical protein
MARTPLRPDIAAARTSAKFSLGSGRELAYLGTMLAADETVAAMVPCRYQGCFGLAVLTDTRLLFLCYGFIWKVSDDVPLDRIGLVQWQTIFGFGILTVHAGGAPLQVTSVYGPGGAGFGRRWRRRTGSSGRHVTGFWRWPRASHLYRRPTSLPRTRSCSPNCER